MKNKQNIFYQIQTEVKWRIIGFLLRRVTGANNRFLDGIGCCSVSFTEVAWSNPPFGITPFKKVVATLELRSKTQEFLEKFSFYPICKIHFQLLNYIN
ncbi:MAG: hypothetical protein Q8877_02560 [Sweet potato little leaf phytoplasma]|nr:hypothetical protein [Sweet potato little leaf phytoplasma]